MRKLILSGKEAMSKIKEGIDIVANPVRSTIGPMGRTVILSESRISDYNIQNAPVIISKDGFRVSQSISSSDPEVQVGVKLIQEACEIQMIMVGDGTSTCALLTQAILEGGLKLIEDGASHVEVKKGIEEAVKYVVEELKKMSIPINGDVEKIRQVATVSANGDTEIGGLIAEAFSKIGSDGVINIEEAKGVSTTIKISDGIKFHRGWASPYFVTNKSKAECELVNPYILIYDRPITILKDLMPILEQVININSSTGIKRPLMIFCDATDGDALATLTFNTAQGNLQSCVVEMAFLGQYKRDFMEDIAAATGGTFVNELKGIKLENVKLEHLGQAQKIVVGKEETVIISGLKDEKIFNSLVDNLKIQEEKLEDGEEKELLKKRIARLKGSVAILSVGATTEVEMKEKKDRVDDAVRATRSALEEGYVPGGGTAFIRCMTKGIAININEIERGNINGIIESFKQTGVIINGVKKLNGSLINSILIEPLKQICINVGIVGNEILDQVQSGNGNFGYNAKTNQIEDLVLAGIIEPTKSNRCALQNAASVCCQILSSQFMITDSL